MVKNPSHKAGNAGFGLLNCGYNSTFPAKINDLCPSMPKGIFRQNRIRLAEKTAAKRYIARHSIWKTRAFSSELAPVRVKKTRQIKKLERVCDSIRSERALGPASPNQATATIAVDATFLT
jgi:hypothetical protein